MERSKRNRRHTINACESISTARSELDADGLPAGSRNEPVRLLVGYDSEVAQWVANELGCCMFTQYVALGMVHEGTLIAGIVYDNYRPPAIEMTVASTSKRWCTKTVLREIFRYPFIQMKCNRVTIKIESNNTHSIQFNKRLGFVHEGTLRQALHNGDVEMFGMLKNECRWIKNV